MTKDATSGNNIAQGISKPFFFFPLPPTLDKQTFNETYLIAV